MLSFIPGMSEFGKEEKVKRLKTNPEEEVDVLRRILNNSAGQEGLQNQIKCCLVLLRLEFSYFCIIKEMY